MALSDKQQKYLRRMGHNLKPIVLIGQAGLTANVLAELEQALEYHELIKVKIRVGDRTIRDHVIKNLVAETGAEVVQRVGNVALIYKRSAERPRLVIPAI